MGEKSFLVVGGGIGGIQASLDLAEMGYRVYLVERTPSIGGKMALLDKTFPTMDCAICILAPKMIEVYRHPNVTLLTNSEVTDVQGEAGDFKVKVKRKPRGVDEKKCVGCGVCASKCPVKVPDEYQLGLGERKAIYLPFPQSVPLVYTIDRDHCLYYTKGVCRVCERFCESKAIDYSQKEETVEMDVAGVIVASGLDAFNPGEIKEYGHGRFKDVLTAMEFERVITATGPTGGELVRLSNKEHPKSVAFIQCVGSRSLREGRPYCSSVCCMHATKEAILAKEHAPDVDVTIFYTDLRAPGKGFREFVNRAQSEYGVKYVRAKPGEIREEPDTRRLQFWYEETQTGEMRNVAVDMLVLCTALTPSPGIESLAGTLGVEVDEYGFMRKPDALGAPLTTTRPGVYVCGFAQGPKDIPDTIAEASGAAALASSIDTKAREAKRA